MAMNLDFRTSKLLEGARRYAWETHGAEACIDCRYAQVFAVQPGAYCSRAAAGASGNPLRVGRSACSQFAPRQCDDLLLASPVASRVAGRGAARDTLVA